MHEFRSSVLDIVNDLSVRFGTGNGVQDLGVVLLLLVMFAMAIAIFAVWRAGREQPVEGLERVGNLGGKLERLEMSLNSARTDLTRSVELLRTEVDGLRAGIIALQDEFDRIRGTPSGEARAVRHPKLERASIDASAPTSTVDDFHTPIVSGSYEMPSAAAEEEGSAQPFGETPAPLPETVSQEVQSTADGSLKTRLAKSRRGFFDKLKALFTGAPRVDETFLAELEALLVSADVGIATAQRLIGSIRNEATAGDVASQGEITGILKRKILEILETDAPFDPAIRAERQSNGPLVVLMVGVNGVGKTTTTAKLAKQCRDAGANVLLVAADTFRAAAVEQLQHWGTKIGVKVVAGAAEAKPQTVVFDAMKVAAEDEVDVVIIDTAGRLHTKSNLMQELEGVRNTVERHQTGAPHEVLLVVDGSTGQNAVSQAKEFHEALKLTGVIVTKLDGTPKGGVVVAIKNEFGIPVRYIGVGEGPEDLRTFVAQDFVEALFDMSEEGAGSAISAHAETRRRKRRDTQDYFE